MRDLLIILVLTVHLLAVNVASAGPLFGIWLGHRRRATTSEESDIRSLVGRQIAWWSVWALLVGMVLGAVQLFWMPSPGLAQAMTRLPARALRFAAMELGFSLACLVIYARYWSAFRNRRYWHAAIALLSCSNLLYHFPPLMSVLGRLAANPRWARAEVLDRPALLPLMARSEVLALSAHFVLASIAVSAMLVLWLASRQNKKGDAMGSMMRGAAWTALIASALQVPVGVWLLTALPKSNRMAMMGESLLASLAFLGAMVLTFWLLQSLLTIALGNHESNAPQQTCSILAAIVLLMTTTLYDSRHRTPGADQSRAPTRMAAERQALHGHWNSSLAR